MTKVLPLVYRPVGEFSEGTPQAYALFTEDGLMLAGQIKTVMTSERDAMVKITVEFSVGQTIRIDPTPAEHS